MILQPHELLKFLILEPVAPVRFELEKLRQEIQG